jgi:hypothetical protein
VVDPAQRRCLPEVGGEDGHALLEQVRELLLVPVDRLGVAEVEHGVVDGRPAAAGEDDQVLLGHLPVVRVGGMHVRELPDREAEPEPAELVGHLLRLGETGGRELEVAAEGDLGPVGVDVDHIGRDALLTKAPGDPEHLVLRLVGLPPHP